MTEIDFNKAVVEAWGFAEFLKEAEPLLKDGWKFDFNDNDAYPQKFGDQFVATLVKEAVELTPPPTTETANKRGRPAKVGE